MILLRFLLLFFLVFSSILDKVSSFDNSKNEKAKKPKTYYKILELSHDASPKDIKKAYRRLALEHHPDRNKGNEEEKTVIFREISEAYEILSDESKRREYDRDLKQGRSGGNFHHRRYGSNNNYQHRDPFSQFNDLFQNDPFFKDAFKDMDDLFGRKFSNNSNKRNSAGGSNWGGRIADMLGVDFNFQTTTTNTGGRSSTSYSHQSGSRSSYSSKSTRTIIQNGQRVTIQSLEKNGNKIEEKYIGNKLIGRTINGIEEDVGRLSDGDL